MVHDIRRHATADRFLDAAEPFLVRREATHNLLLGIPTALLTTPGLYGPEPPIFITVHDRAGEVVAASLRTPPWAQIVSSVEDLTVIDELVDDVASQELRGVLGPKEVAARFASRWTAATGQPARVEIAERIFECDRVVGPKHPAPGAWRFVDERDRDLLARWIVAFAAEATPESPPIDDPDGVAGRWVDRVGRIGYAWEDGGEVVSIVGASGETPNGIRIGPVYTPPERRGRGYASSLTAAATRDQLGRGRRMVYLFTDLANPTSNEIYQAIGYRPVCDVDLYRFEADA